MMQPEDEDASDEEHEIVFDDDDDSVEQKQSRSAAKKALHHSTGTMGSSAEQPLANFQPLKAVHSNEAVTAAMRLESFLSSESNEIDIASTGSRLTPHTGIVTPTGRNPIDSLNAPHHSFTSLSLMEADSALLQPCDVVQPVTGSIRTMLTSSSFEPFTEPTKFTPHTASLFDAVDDTEEEKDYENDVEMTYSRIPGAARFLEMEEEPSRTTTLPKATPNICSIFDPIQTSSGLLLTHRRIPPPQAENLRTKLAEGTASKSRCRHSSNPALHSSPLPSFAARFEGMSMWHSLMQPKIPTSFPPLLRYIRLWVAVSAFILFFGTVVLVHHSFEADSESSSGTYAKTEVDKIISFHEENGIFTLEGLNANNVQLVPLADDAVVPDQIILLPLPGTEIGLRRAKHRRRLTPMQVAMAPAEEGADFIRPEDSLETQRIPRVPQTALGALAPINALKSEFEAWKIRHNKIYHSKEEHHHRFQIWSDNHHRTSEKNSRHGPCQLTGKPVFGVNQFHDLTEEEFQSQYLNGYHLKREPIRKGEEPEDRILGVHVEPPQLHPMVRERLLEQKVHGTMGLDYQGNCKWYDVSCILRYLFSTFLYGLGGTMEPAYDANSYPTCTYPNMLLRIAFVALRFSLTVSHCLPSAIDWRSLGAVTDVHSQGSCGACWAITAVETVESAYFISTGRLYDLAETEVIVCETKCEMCAGGWPQEAFDYVIANSGLPLESDMTYNADFLLLVSEHVAGNSDELECVLL
jgi:Papain family cysteine protease/Cathepsin propeptide inhibitor domain (I29)